LTGESGGFTEPSASIYTVPLHALTRLVPTAAVTVDKNNMTNSTHEAVLPKNSLSPASKRFSYQRPGKDNVSGIMFYDSQITANGGAKRPYN
jgi:hypothetical protein